MKITRENLNSLDADGVDIFEYVVGLVERGEMLTHAEAIIVSFLSHARPDVKEHLSNFEGVRIAKLTNPYPPVSEEFHAAIEKYEQLINECGEDSEEARKQLSLAMLVAPDWFVDKAHKEAKDMGLLPKATECMPDGTPVYTVEQIATHFGISVEEATKAINDLKAHQEDMGLEGEDAFIVDPSLVQKIQ